MPFDIRDFPAPPPAEDEAGRRRPVAVWLLAICAMLVVMIGLGGATRLTGSGLSIMEWAPLSGALPPLSDAEWLRLFTLYQKIPQYDLLNAGFGLDGFKRIFWLEWVHRLWGRLIGVAFAVPLLWFWAAGRIDRRLLARLALILALGGMQGAVGWFMVASGFAADATAVSPYRLVAHLALALALYAAVLWTALGLLRPGPGAGQAVLARRLAGAMCVLAPLTMLAGGFVAGLRAGRDYTSFPLMDGRLVPEGYGRLSPFLRNLTENIAAVQFDHRALATLTALVALAALAAGTGAPPPARRALLALGGLVAAQYALGVATLLAMVPAGLATAHQVLAVLVLTAALVAWRALRAPPAGAPGR